MSSPEPRPPFHGLAHGLVRQEGSTLIMYRVSGAITMSFSCIVLHFDGVDKKTWCLSLGLRGHHHHRTGEPKVLLHRIKYRMPPSPCGSQPSTVVRGSTFGRRLISRSDLCRILDNNGLMLGLRAQIEERLVMN